MSFIEELRESLEELWPIVNDHPIIDRLDVSIDLPNSVISVRLDLETGETVHSTIDFQDSCDTLIDSLASELRRLAGDRTTKIKQALSAQQIKAKEELAIADQIKRLAPTPLEELAMAAE